MVKEHLSVDLRCILFVVSECEVENSVFVVSA